MRKNMHAFLEMLAWSEGTIRIPGSNNGYDVLVGSTPTRPLLFTDYSTHPRVLNSMFNSTAAGRYQIIHPTWKSLCSMMHLSDFTPFTQDAMVRYLIDHDCKARKDIENGDFSEAIRKCAKLWASLPGSTDGQYQNTMKELLTVYYQAGGIDKFVNT